MGITTIKSRMESVSVIIIKPFYEVRFSFLATSEKKDTGRKVLFGRNS